MTTRAKRSAKSQQIEALIGSDRELLDGATICGGPWTRTATSSISWSSRAVTAELPRASFGSC